MTEGPGNQEESQQFGAMVRSAFDSFHPTTVEIIRNAAEEGRNLTVVSMGISLAAVRIASWVVSGALVTAKPMSPGADAILEMPAILREARTAMSKRLARKVSAALQEGIEEEAKALGIPGPVTRGLWSGGSGPVWPDEAGTA